MMDDVLRPVVLRPKLGVNRECWLLVAISIADPVVPVSFENGAKEM
jgi:hypothetical protein